MSKTPTFESLMEPVLRFEAVGDTYKHREILRECAWHWDRNRQVWINENESETDSFCIEVVRNLSGVVVCCMGPAN